MVNYVQRQVFEILEKFVTCKTRKEKIEHLQLNNIMPLKDVLRGTFDDKIQWNLPPGKPPYTANRPESTPSTLLKQHKKFKYFVKVFRESESLIPVKRERMFIDMLESIHPEDADILISMINKKPPVKGLTKKIVEEAFPNLIST